MPASDTIDVVATGDRSGSGTSERDLTDGILRSVTRGRGHATG